jgi:hypothetical protein
VLVRDDVTLARGRVLVSPSYLTTVAGMERLAVGWWWRRVRAPAFGPAR